MLWCFVVVVVEIVRLAVCVRRVCACALVCLRARVHVAACAGSMVEPCVPELCSSPDSWRCDPVTSLNRFSRPAAVLSLAGLDLDHNTVYSHKIHKKELFESKIELKFN